MSNPPMSPPRAEFLRRRGRWLAAAAALALLPKCIVCLVAYVGMGAAFGVGGVELCGATSGFADAWWLALGCGGSVLAAVGWAALRSQR